MQKNIYAQDKTVLKDVIPLELPFCVSIEPTNICNFKCVCCFHGNDEKNPEAGPFRNMSSDIFEKTLCDLKDWVQETGKKIKLIKLYSLGEPLLNPNICNMLKEIKEADVCEKVEITSNGSLLTHDVAEKLIDYNLDIFRLSVYSVERKRMKYVTGSDFLPESIYSNLEYMMNYRKSVKGGGTKIYAKMLDSNDEEENRKFIEQYSIISDDAGIDEVHQLSLGEGIDAFAKMYQDGADEAHQKSLASHIVDTKARRACRYPFTHMTVRNDGTIVMCCADWRKELCIGNVMKHSLKEFWHSRLLFGLRKDMLRTKGLKWNACVKCEIPYRDSPEDDISGVSEEILSYSYDF